MSPREVIIFHPAPDRAIRIAAAEAQMAMLRRRAASSSPL